MLDRTIEGLKHLAEYDLSLSEDTVKLINDAIELLELMKYDNEAN